MDGSALPQDWKTASGEERLDYFRDEAANKRRESFETASTHQSVQSNNAKPSLYMVNEDQRQIDLKRQEQAEQKTLEAIQRTLNAGKQKDFSSLTPQEVAAGVQDVLRRRAISEGPAALANLRQRRAEEAGGLGSLPTPAGPRLNPENMNPVLGRVLAVENGLVDGSAGWALDLQNLLNQGNPNTKSALAPYLETKDELHKKYPGAFTTGNIAGTLASGYLYGVPAKAQEAAGVALRRAAAEEAVAAQRTATQAAREAELGNNPLSAALKRANAKLVQEVKQGYTQGNAAGDAAYSAMSEGAESVLKPQALMDELAKSGVKHTPEDVLTVVKTPKGNLLWLEKGNSSSGLTHILDEHADDLANRGVDDIPSFINRALQETPVKTGSNNAGPFSEYLMSGKMYRVVYGTNGYIVSFYPIK